MANDGDYPFYVKVRNRFEPGKNRPNILVTYNCYLHGICPDNKKKPKPPPSGNTHTIKPGEALSFPLHWRLESLEISIKEDNGKLPKKYYVWCGTEALCHLSDNTTTGADGMEPTIPALEGKRDSPDLKHDNRKYNVGGAWELGGNDKNFTLTIRKRTDDPEEENVTIGENPPI